MERSFTTSSPGPPRRGGVGHLMSSLGNRTETRDPALKGVDDKILKNSIFNDHSNILEVQKAPKISSVG